jgi:hypothetical protein
MQGLHLPACRIRDTCWYHGRSARQVASGRLHDADNRRATAVAGEKFPDFFETAATPGTGATTLTDVIRVAGTRLDDAA